MIPVEVESRIAHYFFHNYLPLEVMEKVEYNLLEICLGAEEHLDHDDLVILALEIINEALEGKRFK